MRLKAEQIAEATDGRILQIGRTEFHSYGIDSRTIHEGALFFAIKGEHTDGHLFVEDARSRGAAGAIVNQDIDARRSPGFTLIQVADSLRALHDLSRFVRNSSSATFIGITGSSGKTSTKEFTAGFLSEMYTVFKSEGNLNSITGLPLSILAMQGEEFGVFEVAMNQPGEIAALSTLLRPDVGVLLNVNPVHLGQFSSIEAIAKEKLSLLEGMSPSSTILYNSDDALLSPALSRRPNCFSFGFAADADLQISDVQLRGVRGSRAVLRWKGTEIAFHTSLCGIGNLYNLTAAACAALTLGMEPNRIRKEIGKLQPYSQRGVLIHFNGIDIYDDSYNSNPRALDIALDLIQQSRGYTRKIAVLGDMLELGPEEQAFHTRAGEQVAAHGFDILITAGPLSKHTAGTARNHGVAAVYETSNSEEAAEKAVEVIRAGDLVLVKGSRGLKMEKVIEELKNHGGAKRRK